MRLPAGLQQHEPALEHLWALHLFPEQDSGGGRRWSSVIKMTPVLAAPVLAAPVLALALLGLMSVVLGKGPSFSPLSILPALRVSNLRVKLFCLLCRSSTAWARRSTTQTASTAGPTSTRYLCTAQASQMAPWATCCTSIHTKARDL